MPQLGLDHLLIAQQFPASLRRVADEPQVRAVEAPAAKFQDQGGAVGGVAVPEAHGAEAGLAVGLVGPARLRRDGPE